MVHLIELLIPLTILTHLLIAPHTKVEESFALQATHDILLYGTPTADIPRRLSRYDHFTFPGAVPRSFIGPLLLAGVSQGPVAALGFRHAQFVVRFVLGMFNAACLVGFARGLRRAFGKGVANWWVGFVVGGFHLGFYSSRTLTNMFAFGLTTLAFKSLLPQKDSARTQAHHRLAISLLVFSSVIFRAEVSILLFSVSLHLLLTKQTTIRRLIPPFVISSAMALLISVPVDSYFWQKPLWPELWAFIFNAVQGNSSEWGTSPWYYYFANGIPRLMMNPLAMVMVPVALYMPGTRRAATALLSPSLLYVAIYSLQPHKETRFIFYVVPPLAAAAALGANAISIRARKSKPLALLTSLLLLSTLASLAASAAMLLLSSLNYPGGDALHALHDILVNDPRSSLSVHADVLTCMTGLTLFGQNPHGVPRGVKAPGIDIVWDKTEDDALLATDEFWRQFDYVLVEDPAVPRGRWEVVGVVEGYAGVEVLKPGVVEKDVEGGGREGEGNRRLLMGKGEVVRWVKHLVREWTGGWWVGPRMEPRIRIMRRKRVIEAIRG